MYTWEAIADLWQETEKIGNMRVCRGQVFGFDVLSEIPLSLWRSWIYNAAPTI